MKRFFDKGAACLLLAALIPLVLACTTTTGTSEAEYGTVINTAKPPANNLFPDFETYVPETAIDGGTSSRSLTRTAKVQVANLSATESTAFAVSTWDSVFVTGGISSIRAFKSDLEILGTKVIAATSAAGIVEMTSAIQSVTVTGSLLDQTTTWDVEFRFDATDPSYIRYNFRNAETGKYVATYLVYFENNLPIKGIVAVVDPEALPEALNEVVQEGIRLAAMSFDFSNSERNLITMRMEEYHDGYGHFYVYHVHQQCDLATTGCIGEYQEISSESPERELDDVGVRFAWMENSKKVCLADIDSTNGETETLHTYAFTGPEAPTDGNISIDTCTIGSPYWESESGYRVTSLPLRYEDTTPSAGTAASYLGDGNSTTSWERLNSDLMTTWLNASKF